MFENGMLSREFVVSNDDVDDRGVVAKERRCSWGLGDYLSSYITNTVVLHQTRDEAMDIVDGTTVRPEEKATDAFVSLREARGEEQAK